MSVQVPQSQQKPFILHIAEVGAPDGASSGPIQEFLGNAAVETSHDVYTGLARILARDSACQGAIVSVEGLGADELEFFEILSRVRRDLPVLVYGPCTPQRVLEALEKGARGLATSESIASLIGRLGRTSAPAIPAELPAGHAFAEGPGQPGEGKTDTRTGVNEAAPIPDLQSLPDKVEEEPVSDGAPDTPNSVRVPWLRYDGGPVRKSPGDINRLSEHSDGGNGGLQAADFEEPEQIRSVPSTPHTNAPASESAYEPLLTEEELAALLGDDDLETRN